MCVSPTEVNKFGLVWGFPSDEESNIKHYIDEDNFFEPCWLFDYIHDTTLRKSFIHAGLHHSVLGGARARNYLDAPSYCTKEIVATCIEPVG